MKKYFPDIPRGPGCVAARAWDRAPRAAMAARRRLTSLAEQLSPVPAPGPCAAHQQPDLRQPPYDRRALLRPGALDSFDQRAWDRDGFVVFAGGLTDWATQQFRASLRRMQAIDDHIILRTDWHGTDWPAFGIPHTERRQTVTRAELERMCGGQERGFGLLPGHKVQGNWSPGRRGLALGGLWDDAPVAFPPGVQSEGLLPSRFAPAYDAFLRDVTMLHHPQFGALQERLLRTRVDDIRMDHVHMLNRRGPVRACRPHHPAHAAAHRWAHVPAIVCAGGASGWRAHLARAPV